MRGSINSRADLRLAAMAATGGLLQGGNAVAIHARTAAAPGAPVLHAAALNSRLAAQAVHRAHRCMRAQAHPQQHKRPMEAAPDRDASPKKARPASYHPDAFDFNPWWSALEACSTQQGMALELSLAPTVTMAEAEHCLDALADALVDSLAGTDFFGQQQQASAGDCEMLGQEPSFADADMADDSEAADALAGGMSWVSAGDPLDEQEDWQRAGQPQRQNAP